MKFKIYLRRFGKLIKLYKLHITNEGLYIISSKSLGSGDHISYHEDGKFWAKFLGRRTIKKLRQPLSLFTGSESLLSAFWTVLGPLADDLNEAEVNLKPEDIVLELEGSFGIEISLSETKVELPELPDRLN